jgi:hypothetical protein
MHVGYVAACPNDAGTDLVYLHDDVKFQPERIMGEALAAQQNNTVFEARHGNWMGRPNNGAVTLTSSLPQSESELQPRIVLYRWNGSAYNNIVLDTYNSVPAGQMLRWNSATGTVMLGGWRTVRVRVQDPDTTPATGEYYALDIEGDAYNSSGTCATPTAPVRVEAGGLPPAGSWGEAHMPITYVIRPEFSDGSGLPAKVVPQSVRVTWSYTFKSANPQHVVQYTAVEEKAQSDLGLMEFCEYMPLEWHQLQAEVRLNRSDPPGPQQIPEVEGADVAGERSDLDEMWIDITYYYRRNFDSSSSDCPDDVVYADYSTGDIINITLIPRRFVELQPYRDGVTNMVVPPDLPIGGLPVHTQAVLLNARR